MKIHTKNIVVPGVIGKGFQFETFNQFVEVKYECLY